MLKRLIVSNLAVVEKAEANFVCGLNVITGETGSGKSVLMGALDLVLGGKSEASAVRDGAEEAEVEAEFDQITVRRTVSVQGRSRAWVNDESVSIAELKELGQTLVDIHGPTANQRLVEESFQRSALDAYGDVDKGGAFGRYGEAYAGYSDVMTRLEALKSGNTADEEDLLRYQIDEIEKAGLTEDDDTLEERLEAASHAEEIIGAVGDITDVLSGDRSVSDMLAGLQPKFRSLLRQLPEAQEWANEVEEMTIRAQELSRTVMGASRRFDVCSDNIDELDRRMAVVNRMKRKYGASVSEILEKLAAKKERLDVLENREVLLEDLEAELTAAKEKIQKMGAELSKLRQAAAEKLSKAVTGELHDLGFTRAKFEVTLASIEPTPHGLDRVVYMFEPNPGEAARPLADIASSGEIARVMLALKCVLAGHVTKDQVQQTLVFDEIDANIGGEVGKIVGEKMRKVARHHQVIAITHLPQSAVYGQRHLVVSKSVSGGRTRTKITETEGEARVSEIARMLGGEKITSVVRRHAEELLQLSR